MADRERMTFDELTSIYRIESRSAGLAEVRKDLYEAIAHLTDDIRREYEKLVSEDPGSIMCEGINERRKKILLYSQKIVDQRMDKIMRLALSGAMGADNTIDHLTEEERKYYHSLLDSSKTHRSLIVSSKPRMKATVLNVDSVEDNAPPIVAAVPEVKTEQDEELWMEELRNDAPEIQESVAVDEPSEDVEEIIEEVVIDTVPDPVHEIEDDEETVTIRVLEDLPMFSGPDRDYELRKEDVIRMPSVMANALISREKAVKVFTL